MSNRDKLKIHESTFPVTSLTIILIKVSDCTRLPVIGNCEMENKVSQLSEIVTCEVKSPIAYSQFEL